MPVDYGSAEMVLESPRRDHQNRDQDDVEELTFKIKTISLNKDKNVDDEAAHTNRKSKMF